VSPPVRAHFVEHDARNERIKMAVLLHQRVAAAASDLKETIARVVDEPVH
jgi:hypothetical protein